MDEYNTRQTLIAKIRDQHNEQAWEDFSYFYEAYIYSIVIRMGVNKSDQDDLVQKIILQIWKSLPNFEYRPNGGKFRSWIYGLTRYQALMHFRTDKRYKAKLAKASDMTVELNDTDSEMDDESIKEWRHHLFQLAWDRVKDELGETYRECFLLFGQGHDVHEVAKRLNIKTNSAHVYRQRVVKRLSREVRFLDDELG